MYASRDFISVVGNIDRSLIPRGSKMFFFMYSLRVVPVSLSRAIPAQSIPTYSHISIPISPKENRRRDIHHTPSPRLAETAAG